MKNSEIEIYRQNKAFKESFFQHVIKQYTLDHDDLYKIFLGVNDKLLENDNKFLSIDDFFKFIVEQHFVNSNRHPLHALSFYHPLESKIFLFDYDENNNIGIFGVHDEEKLINFKNKFDNNNVKNKYDVQQLYDLYKNINNILYDSYIKMAHGTSWFNLEPIKINVDDFFIMMEPFFNDTKSSYFTLYINSSFNKFKILINKATTDMDGVFLHNSKLDIKLYTFYKPFEYLGDQRQKKSKLLDNFINKCMVLGHPDYIFSNIRRKMSLEEFINNLVEYGVDDIEFIKCKK